MAARRTNRVAAVLALVASVSACPSCHRRGAAAPSGKAPEPVAVQIVPVERGVVERTVEITGTFFADEEAVVSAKVAGRIVAISHDTGDVVAPGELLASVDQRDYELELTRTRAAMGATLAKLGLSALPEVAFDEAKVPTVAKADAEAANAQAKFERARQLSEAQPPLIAEQEFADIRTARDVARNEADVERLSARATIAEARSLAAAVAIAEQHLTDTRIPTPSIPGRPGIKYRVAERLVSVGEFVEPGRAVMRLVATDPIKFRARAPERFAGQIAVDAGVRVATDAAVPAIAGRVVRISPVVDPQSRTFLVEILVPNSDGALKPGSFARGAVITARDEQARLVPAVAVSSFAGVDRVYSVKDGKAVDHRVRLGARVGDKVEIAEGLAAESVVSPIPPGLAPGVAVR